MVDTMVLGGTGYVGRHVCAVLAGLGQEVLAVGRDPAKALPGLPFAALDRDDALDRLLTAVRPRTVVNCAGGVWEVSDEEMLGSNVSLVERLLAALARLERPPRLVHLGSAHEYGAVPYGTRTSESLTPSPLTAYGRAKLRSTRMVRAAFEAGVLDGAVLRLSNVLGPGAPPSSLLGAVVRSLRRARASGGTALLPLAAPYAYRDFVDARDVASAIAAAAAGRPAARVLNIGGGTPVPVRRVMERLIAISGTPAEIVERTGGPQTRDNGDWQQLDITVAQEALGWAPRYALTDSLAWSWEPHSRSSGPGPRDEEGHSR
ncbi:NAD-dependent epimerase/dehydratase family protein [Streptomyces acidiscabies]|uniref:NAD(P)-dependent oxidoreductase n=5 Tax=Streptomyces acidiscabies TaxID=42234 RepID=A0AAP6B6H3_9ACTN|nr:NAD(P)-dependent oxidoreductase [Streptomyces acidiscabies]MBZ3911167.1 NAD(P)-dependent oxidoreductase [Streptomyces acidiscabies]MDX2959051.1 NAD(P)-dependent oxidoreductase [Streptomyces acidiscabies]MDX3023899.1 NAD(P)-dependent oxidoreductase [Streptomyces acidiscabies]MDX3788280.1 NAD(P)-dependent oxidoreductase [Streptomyces acidiscabies]